MKKDCPKCQMKMLMTAGLSANASEGSGDAGSKNR